MKYPKLWGGATGIGEALVRIRQNLGSQVNTTYSTEPNGYGSMDSVMTKSCYGYNAIYKVNGEPITGVPFLCTWLSSTLFLPDRTLPLVRHSMPDATAPDTIASAGTSQHIGGGIVAGTVLVGGSYFIRLVYPGSPNKHVTSAEFLAAAPHLRRGMVVDLPYTPGIFGGLIQIIPMGWKDKTEGYVFAVCKQDAASAIGDLGTGGAVSASLLTVSAATLTTRTPDTSAGFALRADDFRAFPLSFITCTGRGRLEYVLRIEERPVGTNTTYAAFTTPGYTKYGAWAGATPSVSAGWRAFNPMQRESPALDSFGNPLPAPLIDYEDIGDTITISYFAGMDTLPAANTLFALFVSTDFGATWSYSYASEFQGTLQEHWSGVMSGQMPGDRSTTGTLGGTIYPLSGGPYPSFEIKCLGQAFTITSTFFNHSTLVTQTIPVIIPPSAPTVIDLYSGITGFGSRTPAYPGANRGLMFTNNTQVATFVGAGRVTFLVMPATLPFVELPIVPGFTDAVYVNTRFTLPFENFTPSLTTSPIFPDDYDQFAPIEYPSATWLFVRSSGSTFTRVSWPYEAAGGGFDMRGMAWASAGDSCAAFFDTNGFSNSIAYDYGTDTDPSVPTLHGASVVATVDGGLTWKSRKIYHTQLLARTCLLPAETGPNAKPAYRAAASFLILTEQQGKFQLYRMSADLSLFERYGSRFSISAPTLANYDGMAPGIINFQKYVHPGFPGVYDGPDEQPRTA